MIGILYDILILRPCIYIYLSCRPARTVRSYVSRWEMTSSANSKWWRPSRYRWDVQTSATVGGWNGHETRNVSRQRPTTASHRQRRWRTVASRKVSESHWPPPPSGEGAVDMRAKRPSGASAAAAARATPPKTRPPDAADDAFAVCASRPRLQYYYNVLSS